jgi:hypothetical protein
MEKLEPMACCNIALDELPDRDGLAQTVFETKEPVLIRNLQTEARVPILNS